MTLSSVRLIFTLALLSVLVQAAAAQVQFRNVTDSAGLFAPSPDSYSYSSIWVDVDNDGLLDLYVAHGRDVAGERNSLFHNLGGGKFEEIGLAAFPEAHAAYTGQMCWGDFNNDGFIDCYESHFNTSDDWLWLNNGDLTFKDARSRMVQPGLYATGTIFADVNSDGLLDLLINTQAWQGSSVEINQGAKFVVTTPFFNGGQGDEILQAFINGDSIPDYLFGNARGLDSIFVSSDTGYRRFDNDFLHKVRQLDDYPGAAAFADLDNDGYDDLLVHYPNKLFVFHNDAGAGFTDRTHDFGLDSARVGTHITIFFYDLDNDGYLDLFLLNEDATSKIFYGSAKGFTTPVELPFNNPPTGGLHNASLTDYDNDGFIDIQHNGVGTCELWRNEGNKNLWLTVDLRGHRANSNGIGSRVIAYFGGSVQYRSVGYSQGNYGYLPLMAHFGFGDPGCVGTNGVIDSVVIVWQPGGRQVLRNVRFNQTILVDQDSGIVRAFVRPILVSRGTAYPRYESSIYTKPTQSVMVPVGIRFPSAAGVDTAQVDAIVFSFRYNSGITDINPNKVQQSYTPPTGWSYQSGSVHGDTITIGITNNGGTKLTNPVDVGVLRFDTYKGNTERSMIFFAGATLTIRGEQRSYCPDIENSLLTVVIVSDTLTSSVETESCPNTTDLTLQPNPAAGGLIKAHFPFKGDASADLRIVDMLGREVYSVHGLSVPSSAGIAELIIPAGVVTRPGAYRIEVSTPVQKLVARLVISR